MGNLQCTNPQNLEAAQEATIIYLQAGNSALDFQNYEGALKYFEKALASQRKLFSPNDISIVNTCIKLAIVYQALENFDQALFFFQKALRKSSRKNYHDKIAYLHLSIGDLYKIMRQYGKALEEYEKGLYKAKNYIGKQDLVVGTIAFKLAKICLKFEMYEEAFDYLVETFHVCVKNYGENHKVISDIFLLMGKIHKKQKNFKDAILFYKTAIKLLEKNLTEDNEDLAVLYNNLGLLLKEERRFDEALIYLEKCIKIEIHCFGINNARVDTTLRTAKIIARMISKNTESLLEPFESLFLEEDLRGKKETICDTTLNSWTEEQFEEREKTNFDNILDSVNEVVSA